MNSHVAAIVDVLDTALSSPKLYTKASVPPVPLTAQFPYVTVQEGPSAEAESLTGRSGLCLVHIQVNCWSPDYEAAWAVREATKGALESYKGSAGDHVIEGVCDLRGRSLFDSIRSLHQLVLTAAVWFQS